MGASGRSSRKSAMESMTEWPIARNFSGARSDGADRVLRELEVPAALGLRPFLAGATLDFGKSPPHFGGQKHITERADLEPVLNPALRRLPAGMVFRDLLAVFHVRGTIDCV